MTLTLAQRQALLLIVALGCVVPGEWRPTYTDMLPYSVSLGDARLTDLCDDLVELGLLHDVGGDFLALFRPTLAGVQEVVQSLQAFLATLPRGKHLDD